MSVVLFPPRALDPVGPDAGAGTAWLTVLGAVATAEVVSAWIGREATIKWPNDVRVDGRKIAGILVERPSPAGCAAVIGIGLNANIGRDTLPAHPHVLATSIQIESGGLRVDRSEVARDLVRRLDHWYDAVHSPGCQPLNAAWRDRFELLGQAVQLATAAGSRSGRIVDLDLHLGVALEIESQGDDEPRHATGAATDVAPRFIRFPLAEIRSIEPLPSPALRNGF